MSELVQYDCRVMIFDIWEAHAISLFMKYESGIWAARFLIQPNICGYYVLKWKLKR